MSIRLQHEPPGHLNCFEFIISGRDLIFSVFDTNTKLIAAYLLYKGGKYNTTSIYRYISITYIVC